MASVAAAALVPGAIIFGFWATHGVKSAKRAARNVMKATCCSPDEPAIYEDWRYSVHTFHFCNGRYAQAFMQANY